MSNDNNTLIEKPRYFGNGMTDRCEIWHDILAKLKKSSLIHVPTTGP